MTLAIDRSSPLPLHEQFRRLLLARIYNQELRPGDALPPERVLCHEYHLSRTTVRTAIDELVQQGVLHRMQGRGTFVTKRALPLNLHRLTSFSADMRAKGKRPHSKVLQACLAPAHDEVADVFDLPAGSEVCFIKRLRYADGQVMGLHETYLPRTFADSLEHFDEDTSLHTLLLEHYQVDLLDADETIEATAATDTLAGWLGTSPHAPLLKVVRTSFDALGQAQEYCVMHYRSDQYCYYVRLHKVTV